MSNKAIAELSADAAILIGHFARQEKGAITSYAEIERLIGWDVRVNRSVMGTVKRRLLKDERKVLSAIMREGYKILTDAEVRDGALARARESRRRSANKSKSQAGTCDIAAMTPADQAKLLGEITAAHVTAEASKDKSVLQLTSHINGATTPLALNKALEALKRGLPSPNGTP